MFAGKFDEILFQIEKLRQRLIEVTKNRASRP